MEAVLFHIVHHSHRKYDLLPSQQLFPNSVFELWPAFNFGLDPSSRGVWEQRRAAGEVTLNSCTFSLVKILPSSGKFRAFSKFSGRTRATFGP